MKTKQFNIAVIGAGIMGSGIAQLCLESGYPVILFDTDKNKLEITAKQILSNIEETDIEKNKERLIIINDLADVKGADIVIEAIVEDLAAKQSLFIELEQYVLPTTILASNTSGISITDIAQRCTNEERIIGTHFFNPAPVMPLVEIITGEQTANSVLEETSAFINTLNKQYVVAKDEPGFIVNRIVTPMLNEAMYCYEQGISSKEEIDKAMKKALGHPMGPLALSDYIGLDTLLQFMEYVHGETGNLAYKPSTVLKTLVAKGNLGVKSGKGFYTYDKMNA